MENASNCVYISLTHPVIDIVFKRIIYSTAYTTFSEITKNKKVAAKLASLYKQIDNIDLWVGGLAEDHKEGSELGETFHVIFREGVLRVRDGDRLWYENIMTKEV